MLYAGGGFIRVRPIDAVRVESVDATAKPRARSGDLIGLETLIAVGVVPRAGAVAGRQRVDGGDAIDTHLQRVAAVARFERGQPVAKQIVRGTGSPNADVLLDRFGAWDAPFRRELTGRVGLG